MVVVGGETASTLPHLVLWVRPAIKNGRHPCQYQSSNGSVDNPKGYCRVWPADERGAVDICRYTSPQEDTDGRHASRAKVGAMLEFGQPDAENRLVQTRLEGLPRCEVSTGAKKIKDPCCSSQHGGVFRRRTLSLHRSPKNKDDACCFRVILSLAEAARKPIKDPLPGLNTRGF